MKYKIIAAWALGKMTRDNFIVAQRNDGIWVAETEEGDHTLLYERASKFSIIGLITFGAIDVFGFNGKTFNALYRHVIRAAMEQYNHMPSELNYAEIRTVLMSVVENS